LKDLTKFEEVLLLTIWRLQDNAYGVRIRQYVSQKLNKDYTYGNLYSALDQLNKKLYVEKKLGDSIPQRRGRRRIYYTLTEQGLKTLAATQKLNKMLWEGIPRLSYDERE
jgi:DNA-binding PadR family transcriptional regulator